MFPNLFIRGLTLIPEPGEVTSLEEIIGHYETNLHVPLFVVADLLADLWI